MEEKKKYNNRLPQFFGNISDTLRDIAGNVGLNIAIEKDMEYLKSVEKPKDDKYSFPDSDYVDDRKFQRAERVGYEGFEGRLTEERERDNVDIYYRGQRASRNAAATLADLEEVYEDMNPALKSINRFASRVHENLDKAINLMDDAVTYAKGEEVDDSGPLYADRVSISEPIHRVPRFNEREQESQKSIYDDPFYDDLKVYVGPETGGKPYYFHDAEEQKVSNEMSNEMQTSEEADLYNDYDLNLTSDDLADFDGLSFEDAKGIAPDDPELGQSDDLDRELHWSQDMSLTDEGREVARQREIEELAMSNADILDLDELDLEELDIDELDLEELDIDELEIAELTLTDSDILELEPQESELSL